MPTRVTKILFSDRGGVSEAGTHELILAGHQALKEVEHPVWLSIWTG